MIVNEKIYIETILIIVIFFLRILLKNKIPRVTFIILWWIVILRLLIPISIQSNFSFYSYIEQPKVESFYKIEPRTTPDTITDSTLSSYSEQRQMQKNAYSSIHSHSTFNCWKLVQRIGAILIFSFFILTHIHSIKIYRLATPIDDVEIVDWISTHKILRKYQVRVMKDTTVPFTYGVFSPIIILPNSVYKEDWKTIQFILIHEFIHIKHFDIVMKWCLVLSASMSWYNPLIWLMYVIVTKDIEIYCDESVVSYYKYKYNSSYALALVTLEEKKLNSFSISNSFAQNAIKERIGIIMKSKKKSIWTIIVTIIIIVTIGVGFATMPSIKTKKETQNISQKYNILISLKPSQYTHMSIKDFRENVYDTISLNKSNYDNMFENAQQDSLLLENKYNNSDASFILNVLFPILSDGWIDKDFNEVISANRDGIQLEYQYEVKILNSEKIKISDYENTILLLHEQLQNYLENDVSTELEEEIEQQLNDKFLTLSEQLSNDYLGIKFSSLQVLIDDTPITSSNIQISDLSTEDRELSENFETAATTDDFNNILSLFMIDNYENMTIKNYRDYVANQTEMDSSLELQIGKIKMLLDHNDITGIDVSKKNLDFISYNLMATFSENQADNTPLSTYLRIKDYMVEPNTYIDFKIYYTITDEQQFTVKQRNTVFTNIISDIENCIKKLPADDYSNNIQDIVIKCANDSAEKNSSDDIKCSIEQLQWVPYN